MLLSTALAYFDLVYVGSIATAIKYPGYFR
jgi:hypothetical protein